jgi:DNA (cytosine-5)-methyltransferase 1
VNVLDLFSGVGGFSLGLEKAGMRTVGFCEINPFCRAVLAKHWPGVPIWSDVRALGIEQISSAAGVVDVVCGGFPCQDISNAGSKAGLAGARSGLWSELLRIIEAVSPRFAIIENVSALRNRGLEKVLADLNALGLDAEWHCVPASALGAPHQRDRIWIIAYPESLRRDERFGSAKDGWGLLRPGQLDCPSSWSTDENNDEIRSRAIRIVDGVPGRVERLNAMGNAVVPQIPEIIGRAIMNFALSPPDEHSRKRP